MSNYNYTEHRVDEYLTVKIYDEGKIGFRLIGEHELLLNKPQTAQVVKIIKKYKTLQKECGVYE